MDVFIEFSVILTLAILLHKAKPLGEESRFEILRSAQNDMIFQISSSVDPFESL